MSLERPTNWKPPEINHGGENIPELFAHLLVDQMVAMICVRKINWELPISNGMDEITKTKNAITKRLRRSGQYNHDSFSSIFTDYKILRDEAFQQIGQSLGYEDHREACEAGYLAMKERFDPDMSTEDALALARNIVADWN